MVEKQDMTQSRGRGRHVIFGEGCAHLPSTTDAIWICELSNSDRIDRPWDTVNDAFRMIAL